MAEFRFWLLQLPFQAQTAVQFPVAFAANVFRGALGTQLPSHLFAPVRTEAGPSGLVEPPRPYVLRASHLDGLTLAPGDKFTLRLHLFAPLGERITEAFTQAPPFHGAVTISGSLSETETAISLLPAESEPGAVQVDFLTPTELKHNNAVAALPHFPVLFARAAARIRTLANFYGQPVDLNFERLTEKAESIELMEHSLSYETTQRYSTRTGQTHPLGGFTGNACYRGQLRELLPILRAAQYTGVGRQTVWGKGEISLKNG